MLHIEIKFNNGLIYHSVYKGVKYIPDYKRQAFTRLRLMSHNLKIETGRWSRIPRDKRVCICSDNLVQDEEHVLLQCSITRHLRNTYHQLDYSCMNNLFFQGNEVDLCSYIHEVVNMYKQ